MFIRVEACPKMQYNRAGLCVCVCVCVCVFVCLQANPIVLDSASKWPSFPWVCHYIPRSSWKPLQVCFVAP